MIATAHIAETLGKMLTEYKLKTYDNEKGFIFFEKKFWSVY